jgi:protein ImuA
MKIFEIMEAAEKKRLIMGLQQQILSLQGMKAPLERGQSNFGLGPLELAFPGHTFPTGAIHEFLSNTLGDAAATTGFMAGLAGCLMQQGDGVCLWISAKRTVFPPALKMFGIHPDRVIFIDSTREKDLLWAVEEALKCGALSVVVGELKEISFTASRRLQLAVEQSRVTGLMHHYSPRNITATATVCRWVVKPVAGEQEAGLPGVGTPCWNVTLQKVRNGKPGTWLIAWFAGRFRNVKRDVITAPDHQLPKTA